MDANRTVNVKINMVDAIPPSAEVTKSSNVWKVFASELSSSLRYQIGKNKRKDSAFSEEDLYWSNVNRNSSVNASGGLVDGGNLWMQVMRGNCYCCTIG